MVIATKTEPAKPTTNHMFYSLLNKFRSSCKSIMPNVFVDHWNECDALLVTKSGYCHEVEMKVSRSDFKADFKKTNRWMWSETAHGYRTRIDWNKHALLAEGNCFPNRFSFLVPDGMVDISEIPPYAGLMTFTRNVGSYGHIRVIRSPKLLHKGKVGDKMMMKLSNKFLWRYIDKITPQVEPPQLNSCPSEEHF